MYDRRRPEDNLSGEMRRALEAARKHGLLVLAAGTYWAASTHLSPVNPNTINALVERGLMQRKNATASLTFRGAQIARTLHARGEKFRAAYAASKSGAAAG